MFNRFFFHILEQAEMHQYDEARIYNIHEPGLPTIDKQTPRIDGIKEIKPSRLYCQ